MGVGGLNVRASNPPLNSKKDVEDTLLFTVKAYLDEAKGKVPASLRNLVLPNTRPCLCSVLSRLVSITSFFGLFPVTLLAGTCEMRHKWISRAGIANLIWLTFISLTSLALYSRVMTFFQVHVNNGTDFYTFGLVYSIQIASSVLIFLCGNVKAPKFVQAWNAFHRVVDAVGMENFPKLRMRIYIIPAFLLQESLLNVLLGLWSHFYNHTKDPLIVGMIPLSGFLVTFVPDLLTSSFVVMLWIIAEHFKTITERVRETVVEANSISISFSEVLEKERRKIGEKVMELRRLHEELAFVVRNLEDAFGIQVLAIFAATSFGFVSGIYGLVISGQGLNDGDDEGMSKMTTAYSFGNVYGGLRLLLILFAAQYVTNAARSPADILNGLGPMAEDVQIPVDRFLGKLGNFPVRISCCDIFTLGNCFLAAAASNVVTYVLVLMQFRLDKCSAPA